LGVIPPVALAAAWQRTPKRTRTTARRPPRCVCERLRALRPLGGQNPRASARREWQKALGLTDTGLESDAADNVGGLGFSVFV
jgi:hypothetical protein